MLDKYFRIERFKSIEGREALHLDELRFQFAFFIFTNAEIKSNEVRVIALVSHHIIGRNGVGCHFLERRISNDIDDAFTGIRNFTEPCRNIFCRFGNTKVYRTGKMTVQVFQKCLIFSLVKALLNASLKEGTITKYNNLSYNQSNIQKIGG